jgi:L-type amino acid transporter 9
LITGEFGGLPDHYDYSSEAGFDIAVAFYSGLWAYDGWNNLNFLTEELINPSRNLPLAIVIAMPIITGIYLLTNISYLTVLSMQEIIAQDAVGIEFANRKLGGASFILPVLIAMSIFGTANGSLFTAGRIAHVAGRDGHLVSVLSYVHATKLTPAVAILFNCAIALAMISYSSINSLIDTFSFASWIMYSLAFISLFVLRYTRPELHRPFRVPLIIPIVAVIMSTCLVVLPIYNDPNFDYFIPIGFCLIGVLLYYPFVYKKKTLGFMGSLTKFIQLLTMTAPSPYKED